MRDLSLQAGYLPDQTPSSAADWVSTPLLGHGALPWPAIDRHKYGIGTGLSRENPGTNFESHTPIGTFTTLS